MCGLYASLGFPSDKSRLDMIAHRGPDGEGYEELETPAGLLCLGHRRLAIIGTGEQGHQPFWDKDNRFSLIFNGEIYNYLEIKQELGELGVSFRTKTDSEVLLLAYKMWGEAALQRFRGMFAFIIYDNQQKTLFAARDRFGIKPLYYCLAGEKIAFASEIKQLHDLTPASRQVNAARAHDYLLMGRIDHTHQTFFKDIMQLRGGESLKINCLMQHITITHKKWYEPQLTALDLTEKQAEEQFLALFTESLTLHLRSDVAIGSCLSGGLDSSSIVSLARLLLGKATDFQTVSACYLEKAVDEKPYMEAVVKHTNSTPHYISPSPEGLLEKINALVYTQDEPFGSTSIYAQYCVFEEAKKQGIKVMLDGQGADEILAGYHFCFPTYYATLLRSFHYLTYLETLMARKKQHGVSFTQQGALTAYALAPKGLKNAYLQHYHYKKHFSWLKETEGSVSHASKNHDINALCLDLTFNSNLSALLHYEDRNSMAHSIEARVPFLDHVLVEFCLSLGNNHKIRFAETKRVLRLAMQTILPKAVLHRQDKLGFATPESQWMKGVLKEKIRHDCKKVSDAFPQLIHAGKCKTFINSKMNSPKAFDFTVWRIANLGQWADVYQIR